MAITSTNRIAGPFTGNGTTTVFTFSFKVFSSSDLFLLVVNSSGTASILVLDTDYTVVLNTNQDTSPGGIVTLTAALATGSLLAITSDMAALQQVVLTNLGGFFPDVFNAVFDELTILVQQLQVGVDQSIKLGLTDNLASAELPPAVKRANMILAFDENGAVAIVPARTLAGPPGPVGSTSGTGLSAITFVDAGDGTTRMLTILNGTLTVTP